MSKMEKELKDLFTELLFDAYEYAECGAEQTIKSAMAKGKYVGFCKKNTLLNLYLTHAANIEVRDCLLNRAIRTYKFTVFDTLPDNERTIETYIDFLATTITLFYVGEYEIDLVSDEYRGLSDHEKYEHWKNMLFDDFVLTFEDYKIVELLGENVVNELMALPDVEMIETGSPDTSSSEQSGKKENTATTNRQPLPKQVRVSKSFSDYLHYDNKDELMTTLHTLLDGAESGREVAKVLEALVKKGYYAKYTRNTPLVITTFNLSCSRQSITKFFNKTNVFGDDEIQKVVEKLP